MCGVAGIHFGHVSTQLTHFTAQEGKVVQWFCLQDQCSRTTSVHTPKPYVPKYRANKPLERSDGVFDLINEPQTGSNKTQEFRTENNILRRKMLSGIDVLDLGLTHEPFTGSK